MSTFTQILAAIAMFLVAFGFAALLVDSFIAWTMRQHAKYLHRFWTLRKGAL